MYTATPGVYSSPFKSLVLRLSQPISVPKLPTEMRLNIWGFSSLHQGSIRVLAFCNDQFFSEFNNDPRYLLKFISQPGAIPTNKEAYQEMMKSYNTTHAGFSKVLMNLDFDVLLFKFKSTFWALDRTIRNASRTKLRERPIKIEINKDDSLIGVCAIAMDLNRSCWV